LEVPLLDTPESPVRNPADSALYQILSALRSGKPPRKIPESKMRTLQERSVTLTEGNFLILFGVPLAIIGLAIISYFLVGKEDPDDHSFDEQDLS
jgi:hypothetical protein